MVAHTVRSMGQVMATYGWRDSERGRGAYTDSIIGTGAQCWYRYDYQDTVPIETVNVASSPHGPLHLTCPSCRRRKNLERVVGNQCIGTVKGTTSWHVLA